MILRFLLFSFTTFICQTFANDQDPGAITFRDNCSACHQFDGSGNESMKAPSLAGLPRWYVSDQLRKFRGGERGGDSKDAPGHLMHMTAFKLDDRIIAYLGQYVQNLKPVNNRHTKDFDSKEKGKELYLKNCKSCHGENGVGNKPDRVPPLDKQPDWYLLNQMHNFEKKLRKHSEQQIPKLSEQQMKNIAAYLTALKN